MKTEELRYLQRLAELYPTIGKASTEIINLQSILNLPKGTEHFLSDIHGEYEAFSHVLRNGSGAVRKKIDDVFGHTLSNSDKRSLATLVYYPKEKIAYVKKKESDMQNWYKITLYRLIEVCKTTASKYTRSKVRKALPSDYAYVIEELITEKAEVLDKEAYYDSIVDTIIDIGRAENFIIALAELIQRLVVDHLHVLGDIYDRGPGPHFIMDRLMDYHSLDIQWGNHDVVWMGAAVGQAACMATVIRNSIRYGNLDATDEEVEAAAALANADDFIRRLPQGYDTMLTGNGANLSQGQRQLIAIARAAVADPPVMILDEATSSIDTRTEAIVQRGMDSLMTGRTVFVIAHRLSTVRNSDAIMVLDHGRIVERGDHEDLIRQHGLYYQLYTGAFELE